MPDTTMLASSVPDKNKRKRGPKLGSHHKFCKKGHLMSETVVIDNHGDSYCGVCRASRDSVYRDLHLRNRYGINSDEFDKIFMLQNQQCAICGSTNFGTRSPAVDHNHATGKIRGILCFRCNRGIGIFEDSPDILLNAVEYLKRSY